MVALASKFVGAVLAALMVSTAALAQSYYDDQACRQFADAQVAPLRDQANSQAVGSALLGAGLGAAVGAAVGGGRGAGIGAAAGAVVGTGVGAANAQNAAGYLQQQYNAYYAQGLSEVSDPTICRPSARLCTGAGLWTSLRLRPPAELSAAGFVPAAINPARAPIYTA